MKDKIDEIYEDIAGRIRNNPDLFTSSFDNSLAFKNIKTKQI